MPGVPLIFNKLEALKSASFLFPGLISNKYSHLKTFWTILLYIFHCGLIFYLDFGSGTDPFFVSGNFTTFKRIENSFYFYRLELLLKLASELFVLRFLFFHKFNEFRRVPNAIQIFIALKQRITREAGSIRFAQPFDGLVGFSRERVNAGDIISHMMITELVEGKFIDNPGHHRLRRRKIAFEREQFGSVEDHGMVESSPWAMPWEQRLHIFVCRDLKIPLRELWPKVRVWL